MITGCALGLWGAPRLSSMNVGGPADGERGGSTVVPCRIAHRASATCCGTGCRRGRGGPSADDTRAAEQGRSGGHRCRGGRGDRRPRRVVGPGGVAGVESIQDVLQPVAGAVVGLVRPDQDLTVQLTTDPGEQHLRPGRAGLRSAASGPQPCRTLRRSVGRDRERSQPPTGRPWGEGRVTAVPVTWTRSSPAGRSTSRRLGRPMSSPCSTVMRAGESTSPRVRR